MTEARSIGGVYLIMVGMDETSRFRNGSAWG